MAEDKHSKTEKPTGKRLKKARQEGSIPKNGEIGAWISLLIASYLVPMSIARGATVVTGSLAQIRQQAKDPSVNQLPGIAASGLEHGLLAVLPMGIVIIVTAIILHIAQGGHRLATKKMGFKPSHLNPFKGIKRMFGFSGVQQTVKSLAKAIVIGLAAWTTLSSAAHQLSGRAGLPLTSTIAIYSNAVLTMMRTVGFAAIIIALVDGFYSRKKAMDGLKMSKHEVKEEMKQAEGNPEVKGAIKSRMYALARNRMMGEIATADVVMANPTHVAVALKYVRGKGAPRVVAKGQGHVATRIREEAEKHRVPIVVDIPLARALYKEVELGREIPSELFTAVARVLAFVMSLRKRGAHAGTHRNPHPTTLAA